MFDALDALERLGTTFVGGPDPTAAKTQSFAEQFAALSDMERHEIQSQARWGSLAGSAAGLTAGYFVSKEISKPAHLIWAGLGLGLVSFVGMIATLPTSVQEMKDRTSVDWALGASAQGFASGLLYMGVYRRYIK